MSALSIHNHSGSAGDGAALGGANPCPLGTTASGTSNLFSRQDHVHQQHYIYVAEEAASGVNGQTAVSASWNRRGINTEKVDTASLISLSGSQMTVASGTYRFLASAPAYQAGTHMVRLQNITTASTIEIGTSEQAFSTDNIQTRSFVMGQFALSSSAVVELQHYITTGGIAAGMGYPMAVGGISERYAVCEFWKT